MKNIRNTLFVATAALAAGILAALCSGCDGAGGEGDVAGDAGAVDVVGRDVGRQDVVRQDSGKADVVVATSCGVPTPKFPLTGYTDLTRAHIFVFVPVESVLCLSTTQGSPQPTNCADPVDGFASGVDEMWFVIPVRRVGNTSRDYVLASEGLVPLMTGTQMLNSPYALVHVGDLAVCSPSGKFLGWGVEK